MYSDSTRLVRQLQRNERLRSNVQFHRFKENNLKVFNVEKVKGHDDV